MRNSLTNFARIIIRGILVFFVAGLLVGCTQSANRIAVGQSDTPTRAAVMGVPLIKQEDYYCGPASLAMVLQWSGNQVTQAEIAAQAFSPGANGTYLADMIGSARRRGQLAVPLSTFPELLEEIASGHPVIVFQNLGLSWAPKWHYAVAVGYDLGKNQIYLHSGEWDRMTMSLKLFERTWRRGDYWAIVVLPPDDLPSSIDQWAILNAVAALERTGQAKSAEIAYEKGASRWPNNWIWPFGLGNARYQNGDKNGARRAYEKAMAIDPSVPEVQNNLSQVNKELAERR